MSARFITELEKEYYEKFKESRLISMMFSHQKGYERLLKKAIQEGKPLVKDDFIKLYGEDTVSYLKSIYEQYL